MLYAAYGCHIYSAKVRPPYGSMELLGEPDVFETEEEAIEAAVRRFKKTEGKLQVVVEIPEVGRPMVSFWYGVRIASYGLDFPGSHEECVNTMNKVLEQMENLAYVPASAERS